MRFFDSKNLESTLLVKEMRDYSETVAEFVELERTYQRSQISLIASSNYPFEEVGRAMNAHELNTRVSEGHLGSKFFPGVEYVEKIEHACEREALELWGLNTHEWGCLTQAISCSNANLAAVTGLVATGRAILSLSLDHGGHLSHGCTKASILHKMYEVQHYQCTPDRHIDYEHVETLIARHRPALIICGGSVLSRDIDYDRLRTLAVAVGAKLLCDASHIAHLMLGGVLRSPFGACDVVSMSTYKGLRGPRAALLFYRKPYENKIKRALFPGIQSGPRNVLIAGLLQMIRMNGSASFGAYAQQCVANAQELARCCTALGLTVVGGDTETSQFLLKISDSNRFVTRATRIGLLTNANMIPGDACAFSPNGVRLGTNLVTTLKLGQAHMADIADIIHKLFSCPEFDDDSLTARVSKIRNDALYPNYASA